MPKVQQAIDWYLNFGCFDLLMCDAPRLEGRQRLPVRFRGARRIQVWLEILIPCILYNFDLKTAGKEVVSRLQVVWAASLCMSADPRCVPTRG